MSGPHDELDARRSGTVTDRPFRIGSMDIRMPITIIGATVLDATFSRPASRNDDLSSCLTDGQGDVDRTPLEFSQEYVCSLFRLASTLVRSNDQTAVVSLSTSSCAEGGFPSRVATAFARTPSHTEAASEGRPRSMVFGKPTNAIGRGS